MVWFITYRHLASTARYSETVYERYIQFYCLLEKAVWDERRCEQNVHDYYFRKLFQCQMTTKNDFINNILVVLRCESATVLLF